MPASSWPEIGSWMIGLLGTLSSLVLILTAVKLVRAIFARNPPVEDFIRQLDHKLDGLSGTMQEKLNGLHGTLDEKVETIGLKCMSCRDDLKLDGSRRSKTLFDYIKAENTAIYTRLNEHDRQIAKLEERTKENRYGNN